MSEVVADPRPLAAVAVSAVAVVLIVASHRHPNLRDGWSVLAALTKFAIVASMLPGVLDGTVYRWSLGTFVPGVEFALRADPLGMLFGLLASFLWIFTAFYSIGYMRGLGEHAQTRFFAAFAASLSTALGIAFAQNLLTIFVFYELLSLVTYPLVAHDEDDEARIAGRKYLFYTFLGGGVFLLAGAVVIFWLTGTVDFVAGGIPELAAVAASDPWWARLGFGLLIAGFAVKAAVMPLHSWLPDAMVAPTPVSGLLHAVAVVKSGAFGIARVILDVYGPDLTGQLGVHIPLAILAGFTLVAASVIALRKDNLKRRLAYSTVAQLSYIVLGLSLLHPYALIGGLLHIPAHAFGKLTLFFCAGAIHVETHTDDISDMAGIAKRMPLTMSAFAVGAAGMAGMPLIAGFVSKLYLLLGSLGAGGLGIPGTDPVLSPSLGIVFAASLVVSGVLNVAYFWPIVYAAFFEAEDAHDAKPLLEFPMGGRSTETGEPAATDGGVAFAPDRGEGAEASAGTEADDGHADGGGPPSGGWERRSPTTESTWLMLLPIAVIATGAIVLGVVPGPAVFLELISYIVESLPGVMG